ncbi:hypothetical protein AKJ51_00885 [candidate division MSBL1 archaeon SCGC-AAA382A20]|uniref:Uncharacterized protein n=1 Tax=candidate division MSBL1 archaeon SCGC-AAA382A20 TaxID=1698280 RepID=A0A133VMA2_9EURY|nr:hypothetical protein AKJ51_00885 [candidate division MSBL1 archaeon SCGC-AAA382A20]
MKDHNHEEHLENHLEADNLHSFSFEENLTFDTPVPQGEIRNRVFKIVNRLARRCIEEGADLIGHIKGRIEMKENLRFNLIESEEGVKTDGDIQEDLKTKEVAVKILAVVPLQKEILDNIRKKAREELLEGLE